jgi:ParB/RepB/Spo0J family partition protein
VTEPREQLRGQLVAGISRPHHPKEHITMDTQTHTTEAATTIAARSNPALHPIPLADLHVSPLNMRAEKKEPSLKRMAAIAANILPTIREQGIQTPLIVRPNNIGFEIIAGRRRFYAARVIADEKGNYPNIRCDVREGLSDAEALEISLIENLAREDADELTYYEAFLSLTLKGRSVGEIARTYGKSEREVQQYLALANLLPAIRELYREEHLDAGDLRLLTMATTTQQREWFKLFQDDNAPTGSGLKGWLLCRARRNSQPLSWWPVGASFLSHSLSQSRCWLLVAMVRSCKSLLSSSSPRYRSRMRGKRLASASRRSTTFSSTPKVLAISAVDRPSRIRPA